MEPDTLDSVSSDCETNDNGTTGGGGGGGTGGGGTGGGGTGGGGTGGGGTGGGGTGTVTIPARSATMSKKGVVPVTIQCQGSGSCEGTVQVDTVQKVRVAMVQVAAKVRRLSLGTYKLSLAANGKTTIRIRLSKKLRKLVKRKKLRSLRITTTLRDSAGNSTTTTKTIRIKAAKR